MASRAERIKRVSYTEAPNLEGSATYTALQTSPSSGAVIADYEGITTLDVPATRQAWAKLADGQGKKSFADVVNLRLHTDLGVSRSPSSRGLHYGRAEQYLLVEDLKLIRNRFEKYNDELTLETFLQLLEKLLTNKGVEVLPEEIVALFHRIDYDCSGTIDWNEISSYMYLEFKQRNAISNRAKGVEFQVPAIVVSSSPHRDSLCRIAHLSDGSLVTCSTNGVVCIWTRDMEPKRVRKPSPGQTGKPKWVTDMAVCATHGKVILTTGDCEIQFYEIVNFQPCCQLKRLEAVPLKLEFWVNPNRERECLLLTGDQLGVLTVVMISDVQEAFKHWKLGQKSEGIPTYPFAKLASINECTIRVFRWKLHRNWTSEVHYFPTLRCFASCSCDETSSLVIGSPTGSTPVDALLQKHRNAIIYISRSAFPAKRRLHGDQRVYKIHSGVSSVDYCSRNNLLVTGSPDQYVRIWNPYITSKPVAVLSGHGTPLFCVRVESSTNKIYSIGSENTIKVWDILDHTCLNSLTPGQHRLFTAAQAFHVNPVTRQLLVSTEFEHLAVVQMEQPKSVRKDIVSSHKTSITAVTYSQCFNKIISACEGAFVKVWDLNSGVCVFEYLIGNGISGITAIDIDHSGRRLVTATQNGAINMWNFNNGQCITTLDKDNSEEITDIKFVTVKKNRYIIPVGWDHKITIFADDGSSDDVSVRKPLETWSDSAESGHKDDIMSVAFGSPDLMATAGSNGEIIIWRLILCNVICKLKPPIDVNTDREVQKLLFLEQRMDLRSAATLVAGGPAGYIQFWNIYDRSEPMSCFLASEHSAVATLTVDSSNNLLLSADLQGYITVWNIQHYCIASKADKPPHRVLRWRAHTQKISSIVLIDQKVEYVIVTGSIDGSVRLWTKDGHYISTFGQEKSWILGKPQTYQHPLLPTDIHEDSSSSSSVANKEHVGGDECEYGDERQVKQVKTGERVLVTQRDLTITEMEDSDEEESDELLHKLAVPRIEDRDGNKVGMRLRHLRSKSALRCRPGAYATLSYQFLDDEPNFDPPASVLTPAKKLVGY